MANIDLKFLDGKNYIQVNAIPNIHEEDRAVSITGFDATAVPVDDELNEVPTRFCIWLDIPTAIKFAKTLRTEINKAKEGLSNG